MPSDVISPAIAQIETDTASKRTRLRDAGSTLIDLGYRVFVQTRSSVGTTSSSRVIEPCICGRATARTGINDCQYARLLACRELVVDKVHGPDVVRTYCGLADHPLGLAFTERFGCLLRN